MVGLVEACLSLDFEDWVDVLAELYQVPTLVTDFRFTGFVGLAFFATFVVPDGELGVRGLQRLLWRFLFFVLFSSREPKLPRRIRSKR